jgi:uncharacterized protein involved in exopolysaccharide biosynthesis
LIATLETIFRRPIHLLFLILLLPALAIAVVYFLPRSYQSTASLWALRRYIVIGATGPESDLTSTPAQTQATALTELLHSRTFALTAAHETQLASTLAANVRANPQSRDDALFQDISTNVIPTAQGYNLFNVTYTNRNPKVAQEVLQAVIRNFDVQSESFSSVEARQILASYQTQLNQAKQQADAAAQAEAQYIQNNPYANFSIDPQYQLLHSETQQAQGNVANIQTQIDTINQEIALQGSGPGTLFQTLDPPLLPTTPVSRLKTFLIAGGVGLGIALLACILYIVLSVRRNRVVYTPLDLEKVAAFPVAMELPQLSPAARTLLALGEPPDSFQRKYVAANSKEQAAV